MASPTRARLVAMAMALLALGNAANAGSLDKAAAETPVGVVELFTSQGCSSCPPADEIFAGLAARRDVVALAYHVDYWDYLGWPDALGSKQNTARQYDYMRAFGARSVYTPQAVINGRTHVSGANLAAVDKALTTMAGDGDGLRVPIAVSESGDGVTIEAGAARAADATPPSAHLLLVYFDPPRTVEIGKGENSGRKLTYWNAVSDVQTAGMWRGKAQRYELPLSEISKKAGCAVLLQSVGPEGLPGPIIGAAFVRRPSL